jgi:hypothetical protein
MDDELSRLRQRGAEEDGAEAEAGLEASGASGASGASEDTLDRLAEPARKRAGTANQPGSVPPRTWLQWFILGLLVVGFFALKEAVFWNPPLTFTVGTSGQSGVLRDWEEAPDDARLPLRFSDGSRVELEPAARARVVAVGRAGAELVIESGRAQVSIAPARFRVPGEIPWRINLGSFVVEVKGTRFDVEWDPRSDDFSLDVFEGTVLVNGCGRESPHTVGAGQGLRASCRTGQWTVVSLSPSQAAARQ